MHSVPTSLERLSAERHAILRRIRGALEAVNSATKGPFDPCSLGEGGAQESRLPIPLQLLCTQEMAHRRPLETQCLRQHALVVDTLASEAKRLVGEPSTMPLGQYKALDAGLASPLWASSAAMNALRTTHARQRSGLDLEARLAGVRICDEGLAGLSALLREHSDWCTITAEEGHARYAIEGSSAAKSLQLQCLIGDSMRLIRTSDTGGSRATDGQQTDASSTTPDVAYEMRCPTVPQKHRREDHFTDGDGGQAEPHSPNSTTRTPPSPDRDDVVMPAAGGDIDAGPSPHVTSSTAESGASPSAPPTMRARADRVAQAQMVAAEVANRDALAAMCLYFLAVQQEELLQRSALVALERRSFVHQVLADAVQYCDDHVAALLRATSRDGETIVYTATYFAVATQRSDDARHLCRLRSRCIAAMQELVRQASLSRDAIDALAATERATADRVGVLTPRRPTVAERVSKFDDMRRSQRLRKATSLGIHSSPTRSSSAAPLH